MTVVYRLEERAVAARARAASAIGTASNVLPALLVVVLLVKLGYVPVRTAFLGSGFLGVMALLRATVKYRQIARHLRAFEVTIDDAFFTVKTLRGDEQFAREAVERIVTVDGALGGLRIVLAGVGDADEPNGRRLDIPRGGSTFGDLRAALSTWRDVERAPRRRRFARAALVVVVVLAIFFVPFFMADLVGRSRGMAIALVSGLWVAMLIVRGRG